MPAEIAAFFFVAAEDLLRPPAGIFKIAVPGKKGKEGPAACLMGRKQPEIRRIQSPQKIQ